MRITHLVVLAAVVGVANEASAQESRIRVATPADGFSYSFGEPSHRAVIGISTGMSGTARDTLGLLVQSVTKGSPAEKAGLEEGNRIASVNNVNLRADKADLEDNDMSGALQRRLTRELGKLKAGDEVDLRVYRDGKFQNVKIKTVDADSLFRRSEVFRNSDDLKKERENRAALGLITGTTGSSRDTLGVLVMSVVDSSPALRAGIEEGNRIAAINGVSLRVAREDAGDRSMSSLKAQRFNREMEKVKAGDNVTLSIYSSGRFRDVTLKAARAADLPHSGGYTIFGGDGFGAGISMPRVMSPNMTRVMTSPMRLNFEPEMRMNLDRARVRLEELRPMIERSMRDVEPRVRMQLENLRPQLERSLRDIRPELDRARELDRVRVAPRVRTNWLDA